MSRRSGTAPAGTPAVNLLSPWSFEAMAARRLRRRFVLAGIGLVLLLTAGWAGQHLRAGQAEQILAIEQAERSSLAQQTAELAPVRTFVAAVAKRQQTVSTTMAGEVRFSRLLSELSLATPADAELTSLSVTLTPAGAPTEGTPAADAGGTSAGGDGAAATPSSTPTTASACPGPDPFGTRSVIGCLTLSGTAASRDAVGRLVVDLGRSTIFVEPFVSTTTTAEGPRVTFTGTVGVSPRAFTGRYDDLAALLSGQEQ